MQARKQHAPGPAPHFGRKEVLSESASSGLAFSAARVLNGMVGQAKSCFDAGLDPDYVFGEFDIEKLKTYIGLEPNLASELLYLYKDRKGDERFSACVLVATAIFFTSIAEPDLARGIVARIVRKARKDESFTYMAKITLISVAELSRNTAEEAGCKDEEFMRLGERCMGIFAKL